MLLASAIAKLLEARDIAENSMVIIKTGRKPEHRNVDNYTEAMIRGAQLIKEAVCEIAVSISGDPMAYDAGEIFCTVASSRPATVEREAREQVDEWLSMRNPLDDIVDAIDDTGQ